MAELTKFLSLGGLQRYDSKIKAFISEKVAGHLLFEIVESLASVTTPKDNVIYLIPNAGNPNNVKDEYMWINEKWELIGTTAVDLTPYYKIKDADAKFEPIVNADLVRGRVSGLETRMTTAEGEIDALQAAVADVYTKGEIDGKVDAINGDIAKKAAQADLTAEVQAREALAGVVATKAAQKDLEAEVQAREALAGVVATKATQADLTTEVQAREALAERVATAEGEIDDLQAAVADVYTKDEVNTLINGVNTSAGALEARVAVNEGAISGLKDTKADKTALEEEVEAREALAERVATAEGEIDALQAAVDNVYTKDDIDGKVDAINGDIAKKAAQKDLEAEVQARGELAGVVATKANADDVYTKTDVDGKVNTINAAIDTKATKATTLGGYGITDAYTKTDVHTAIATATESIPSIKEDIQTNRDNIADLKQLLNEHMNAIVTDAEIDALFAPASPEQTPENA